MYLVMALMALAYAPLVLLDEEWAFRAVHAYCRYVRWSARVIIGLRSEIRGVPPSDEVVIAAKHQSFFDIIMIVSAIPRPKFIMKKELTRTPFVGWYARKIGCVPVDRGRRGHAIQKMIEDVGRGQLRPGQLIIYPQGTRVAPGQPAPYKIGTAILYEQLGQDCVPVATNVGVFWPRRSILRRPGLAVVEFLPRIAPGLRNADFMRRLEAQIEGASDRLMEEAGFSLIEARPPQTT
ncbi:lysophospholipid acyltransferase family protein [Roseitranquillus sediminis]|uniref:lysophospholipid acyltransferase family protein n=1 Tax=Roseitranquillus sediminis TaxID=2809051 RepID=UPI001D0C1408|nr:lysophospholipid acyltransferase family protein [Roseitranquillus sediminis]